MSLVYIESTNTLPEFNLAMEQYVFDCMDRKNDYFILWQNENTVVVGKNQNTYEEVSLPYIKNHHTHVVRRLSGGGAVYHDLGNLNFTFIINSKKSQKINFDEFTTIIAKALNDSQYIKGNRTMHHGCLLYETKLDEMSKVLNVSNTKIISKGIKSVQSRVANICSYMKEPMTMEEFKSHLVSYMSKREKIEKYMFSEEDIKGIERLKASVYDTWEWNYGASPEYNVIKSKRFEECGEIKVFMVVKYGIIQKIQIYGDFFGCMDVSQLTSLLEGCKLRIEDLRNVLGQCDIGQVIHNFSEEQFLELMME